MDRPRKVFGLVVGLCVFQAMAVGGRAAEPAGADDDRDRVTVERFLALLEKSPRRGTALDRVYGHHVERGSLDTLIKGYQARTVKDPKDGTAWMLLGLLEAQRGRDSAAVSAFKQAEATRPDDALAAYYLGQALVLVGQPGAAADAFERAIERKPTRADLLQIFQALGRVHQRAYHADKALAVWSRLEALFPDDLRVQEQIASALAEEAEPARALPRYEALAQKTTDPYRKVEFRMEAGELKVRLNRRDEALADFESLLGQLNPESWLYREVRHKIEEVFLRNDDQSGLAAYYERWLKKNPEDVEAMARLGRTLASLGRASDARGWFDKAVKLAPTRKELRLALVDQLVQEKKFREAAAQYEALAQTDPNNPDLIRDWGRLLLKDTATPEPERKQGAADVWRKLLDARPKDAATAVLVADLFRQAEMPDEAVDLYRKAIALVPDAAQYYEYLGEYYHSLKRTKEAQEVWAKIAEGKNRTAKNLARLAEVLAGFGYVKDALAPIAAACTLDPDSFDVQAKYADLLLQSEKYDDALAQLDAAARAADDPEQTEAVLDLRIKTFHAQGKLTDRTEALRKALDAGQDVTAERWRTLARMCEADQKMPEATAAISKAAALDERSVPSWAAYARIHEATGDFGRAVEAYRKLAKLDRRALTEYLTQVAKLEVRLGRRDRALEAGREVLAASPGNPESYQFYADLCTQLGDVEEGLNTLRRAVRVNPNDNKALLTLGEALAREFRTEEAIELYWRAFDKAGDLDGKLGIVSRLTDLYLQRNQFDRLVGRLEREQREAKQPREYSICLAQAYQASGDYGSARTELERLLATNARDTVLLQQLSSLAETDGDLAAATKYQRQLNEIAPTDDGAGRLAQLHMRAGEANEAEVIWARMAGGKQEIGKVLQTIDHLLTAGKAETALGVTERVLRDQPGLWEMIYREGVALAALEKPAEAERRFRAILDLNHGDDEESEEVKAARRPKPGKPVGAKSRSQRRGTVVENRDFPKIQTRAQLVYQVLQATGLSGREYYNLGSQQNAWSPGDFGQARMAALGWLLSLAQKTDKVDDRAKEFGKPEGKAASDPRKLWDWYYLSLVRQESAEPHDAALALSRVADNDPAALWVYLMSLPSRGTAGNPREAQEEGAEVVDKTPPLPPEELDHVLACYQALRARKPDWADAQVIDAVAGELKRAKKVKESDRFYEEALTALGAEAANGAALALATRRGDMDAILKLIEKQLKIEANQPNAAGLGQYAGTLEQLMADRAAKKGHADVLKLFDYYFDWYVQPDHAAARMKSHQASTPNNPGAVSFNIKFGKQYRYINIDYPMVNRYYDHAAIQMLRTAFEVYKRDDLLSDLFGHLKQREKKAPEAARIYSTLALGYLHWWNDDKDEAIRALSRAGEEAKADPDMQLELADLRARRNETDEALALVESVEPLDQKTMQRREIMALRLAVLTGNVERARLAAERLFNLRLDTETQVKLAAQMHQLGMNDLAEAVLARARRRAGGNTNTLVGLMNQYQQQNKMDVAVQVAHQILRHAPARQSSPYQDSNDSAHREAIQVLARSGKIQELIDRVEAQLKTSPHSVQLLQTLADYQKAAGAPEKAKAALDKIAQLRPDDASLRYQTAMQLIKDGDTAGALPHLKAALSKEPTLFTHRYWEIQNAYQNAGKLDDLAQLFENIDIKKLGNNFWSIEQLVSQLMQNDKSRDRGMSLFRKMWKAFPTQRANMIASLYSEEIWKLPEMYDFAREAIIPTAALKHVNKWAGIDQIYSWGGGGQVNGVADHLLGAAQRQNKLNDLAREIEEALKRVPEWSGGKAYLALIDVRRGKLDDAQRIIKELLANDTKDKEPIPYAARLFIGQELENFGPFQQTVLHLYETAQKDESSQNSGLDFEFHPVRRLIALYQKAGRTSEARDLVLKAAKKPDNNNYGDPGYAAYRRIESLASIGRVLNELGFPADAVPLFNEALSDPESLRLVARFYGGGDDNYVVRQLRDGLNLGMRSLNDKNLPQTVRTLLKPVGKTNGQALDLVLLIHPRSAETGLVRSLFAESISAAAGKPELRSEIQTQLADVRVKHPKDFSAWVATALVAALEAKPEPLAEAAERLAKMADEAPLDDISTGTRPNARQRTEAAERLGLWLVARECWKYPATRATGDRLAAQALEAAKRQNDQLWPLAMLREWGQNAYKQGDHATAERRWTQMLDLVLASLAVAKPKGPDAKAAPGRPANALSVTLERFEFASQLAKLAAGYDLVPLSLRAVRQSLAGGPPVVPMPIEQNNGGMTIRSNNNNNDDQNQTEKKVEERLAELNVLWQRHQAPAAEVYAALRDAVLPEGRPAEIFLYPRPLSESVRRPRSAGATLASWAARGGALDDLRKRLDARQDQPTAVFPALVLRAQLALAAGDHAATVQALAGLEARLKKDSLQHSATLACLVALPALEQPETAPAARAVLDLAVKNLSGGTGTEPLAGLHLALAHAAYKEGKPAEGRKQLQNYHGVLTRTMPNYGGDYGLHIRKQHLQQVALEYTRAGQWTDALDVLGQFVDAPSGQNSDPGLGNVLTRLARHLASAPAQERYEKLKAWSLPTANRNSVRLLATFVPEDVPPEIFGKFQTPAFDAGVVSTAGMLIDAAREAGTLDDLAREAARLAARKVENGEALLILTHVARDLGDLARPRLRARLDDLKKNPNQPVVWSDVLLTRAALRDPALRRDPGEALARYLIGRGQSTQHWDFLAHLRRDLAESLVARAGATIAPGSDPGLAHWHPGATVDAGRHATGTPPAWWVEAEGNIQHVVGPQDQFLLFDTPLTGTFEFSADVFLGGWAEGEIGYGGLIAEANSNGVPSGVFPVGRSERVELPSRFAIHDAFNRMTVRVEPGKVQYLNNGHLFYEDKDPSPTSPWLALFCSRERQSTFRDLTLKGSPTIPREVALTHADRLEGWVGNFINQTQPPRRSLAPDDLRRETLESESVIDRYDWVARDGEVQCRRTEPFAGNQAVQSRLYYHRPLRPGDSVSYEFYYEPGEVMVHPCLDRTTFLLDPDGVRLHYITDGLDDEWTGLSTSNTAEAPQERLGPERLPLKAKAWNSARVSLEDDVAVVTLNGTEVYRRTLEPGNSRQFGVFHFRDRTMAQFRNVVLKGDWPRTLPAEVLADPAARRPSGPEPQGERRARHDVLGEELLVRSSEQVLNAARSLPPAARYEALARWVLPRDDQDNFRLECDFTPTDAAPPVATPGAEPPDNPGSKRVHTGGQLEAPALELVATARALGKLDDLAGRIGKARPGHERGRLAMLALIEIAQGRDPAAKQTLVQLRAQAQDLPQETATWLRRPEQVAQWAAIGHPLLAAESLSLAYQMHGQWHGMRGQGINPRDRDVWGRQIAYATRRAAHLDLPASDLAESAVKARLPFWSPVEYATAESRGRGTPIPRWTFREGFLRHNEGHREDFLYFNVPLRGDFEVTCEVKGFGSNQLHLVYGGLMAGLEWDRKECDVKNTARQVRRVTLDTPIDDFKSWYPCRIVVKDHVLTTFVDGRKLVEETIPGGAEADPWLAIHEQSDGMSDLRNLKLGGTPTVPVALELSDFPDLTGWRADYYQERLDGKAPAWAKQGEEIVGRNCGSNDPPTTDRYGNEDQDALRNSARLGSKLESLLQYHRPLLEDGEVRYEFFYVPGKTLTHPVLDRLTFLLDPGGVKVHWLTDAQFDRTGLGPDNASDEPKNRRGPARLPLKANDWNHVTLTLAADTVQLTLNGELVYERPLEPANGRQFGLFHYADETEVRVRRVYHEGHWPRAVPPDLGFPPPSAGAAARAAQR